MQCLALGPRRKPKSRGWGRGVTPAQLMSLTVRVLPCVSWNYTFSPWFGGESETYIGINEPGQTSQWQAKSEARARKLAAEFQERMKNVCASRVGQHGSRGCETYPNLIQARPALLSWWRLMWIQVTLSIGRYIAVNWLKKLIFSDLKANKKKKSLYRCLCYLLVDFFVFFPFRWMRATLNTQKKTFLKIQRLGFKEEELGSLEGPSQVAYPSLGLITQAPL